MDERVQSDMEAVAAPDLDAQLMLRVREGDDESFRVLLEKHRNPLVHFLQRMVQDAGASEELAQEVFLRIYRSRGSYEPSAKFTTWMFRIASHLALNWLRDERHERAAERLDAGRTVEKSGNELALRELRDSRPLVEQSMVHETRLQEIRDSIAALPAKQRAAVLMHKYEEMGYSQIAQALECSESAVKSLLFRAYETLRARLAHLATGVTP
ncbi:MAG TPA: RNA polymerase sigma factor [Bryobacteraceae bacterium]|nr:RNA polymerase sigma factor [Bryobacteraceae bacterium]